MRINQILKQMLGLAALTAALWLVYLYGRVLSNSALILVWIATSMLLGLGLWRRAKSRRRVCLAAYLLPGSGAFRFLRGGLLMALGQGIVAIVMALYLLLAVLRLDTYNQWLGLLCAALILPVAAALVAGILQGHIVPSLREELSLHLALNLLAGALLIYLVWQALGVHYPDFRGASLEQAVWHAVSGEQARSPRLLTLLEMAAASDGLQAWLAQRLLPAPGSSVWQAAAWCLVFAREVLFAWSYLLLCRGALALPQIFAASAGAANFEEPHA